MLCLGNLAHLGFLLVCVVFFLGCNLYDSLLHRGAHNKSINKQTAVQLADAMNASNSLLFQSWRISRLQQKHLLIIITLQRFSPLFCPHHVGLHECESLRPFADWQQQDHKPLCFASAFERLDRTAHCNCRAEQTQHFG